MNQLSVVKPLLVTPAMLVSTDVPLSLIHI